jgi:hypothetical protein
VALRNGNGRLPPQSGPLPFLLRQTSPERVRSGKLRDPSTPDPLEAGARSPKNNDAGRFRHATVRRALGGRVPSSPLFRLRSCIRGSRRGIGPTPAHRPLAARLSALFADRRLWNAAQFLRRRARPVAGRCEQGPASPGGQLHGPRHPGRGQRRRQQSALEPAGRPGAVARRTERLFLAARPARLRGAWCGTARGAPHRRLDQQRMALVAHHLAAGSARHTHGGVDPALRLARHPPPIPPSHAA